MYINVSSRRVLLELRQHIPEPDRDEGELPACVLRARATGWRGDGKCPNQLFLCHSLSCSRSLCLCAAPTLPSPPPVSAPLQTIGERVASYSPHSSRPSSLASRLSPLAPHPSPLAPRPSEREGGQACSELTAVLRCHRPHVIQAAWKYVFSAICFPIAIPYFCCKKKKTEKQVMTNTNTNPVGILVSGLIEERGWRREERGGGGEERDV